MRLIDADNISNVGDYVKLDENYNAYVSLVDLCKIIDIQPTAYDIDGVIEQLKRCYGIVRSTSVDYAEGLKDAYERAIGIVKVGGTCQ